MPVVFLSYREPNADENYARLEKQGLPRLIRVHGVKGFDAAHKEAAARAAANEMGVHGVFITVDGDNEVMDRFWELSLNDIPTDMDPRYTNGVLSWNSYNPLTGLAYGNGGLKLWSMKFVQEMQTHELIPGKRNAVVDFCWKPNYIQLKRIYSVTRNYASKDQAFVAGFREGAKMGLIDGKVPGTPHDMLNRMNPINLMRFQRWAAVGRHMEQGEHSIYGALYGFHIVHCAGIFPLDMISDLDYLYDFYRRESPRIEEDDSHSYLRSAIYSATRIQIPKFGAQQSQWIVDQTRPSNSAQPFDREVWNNPIDVKS